ncbi:MAG: hypothetical protein JL55_14970 [Pseudomonas sp. BICA1-14]|nr:hypothetical protein [[Pseudomonas] sp. BICA1-14]KJS78306.1 MAG: hypothetical protein JL55_14970 [[Pseudomonas] sp. BICA1-14]
MLVIDGQEMMDFSFSSSGRGKWCLVNHDVDTPWIHISFIEAEGRSVTRTLLTSDMALVKEILKQSGAGLRIKSFQAVFPSDFPDNQGWGIAEIYEFTEKKTRKGMVFHTFVTKFGVGRIGGSSKTMASEVLPRDENVLYKAARPQRRERRYFE